MRTPVLIDRIEVDYVPLRPNRSENESPEVLLVAAVPIIETRGRKNRPLVLVLYLVILLKYFADAIGGIEELADALVVVERIDEQSDVFAHVGA